MTLNERLKKARKKAKFTQVEIAEKLDIGLGTVKRYEKDASKIPVSVVSKIALLCDVDEIWLFTGKEPPYIKGEEEKTPKGNSNLTRLLIEHQDMIPKFKKPDRAKAINENLLEIETISDELMENIASHIETSLNAARIATGSVKKTKKNQESSAKKRA